MKVFSLGNDKSFIANHFNYPKITDRLIPQYEQIKTVIEKYKPDVLINCIGYCGNTTIDDCELDLKRTFDTNTLIPIILGSICEELHIRFVNISSGCIFSGTSPNLRRDDYDYSAIVENNFDFTKCFAKDSGWTEKDSPTPPSSYSKSKYAADLILESLPHTTLLRIRMPISYKVHPRNLLSKLTSYTKIVEAENSMTFMGDLERAIEFVIENDKYGIYNCTSPTPIKHSKLLDEYKKYVPNHKYEKISVGELNRLTKAIRSNCILDSSKLVGDGFKFQDTDKAVIEYVEKFAKNLKA